MALKEETRARLMQVSTATLCTALYKRGLRQQFIQDVRPLNPNGPNMVGEAFTLRYIPAREDLNPLDRVPGPCRIRSGWRSSSARPARCWCSTAARMRAPRRPARSW